MRIAYLILAHQNIDQLALLIDTLTYGTRNFCFLHLDARLHTPSFSRKLNKLTKSQNWYAIKKRLIVNWGGFSMVEATLNLMLAALNYSNIKFDYLSLHSGMDFPIKSNQEIEQYLINNKEHQFMEFFKLPNLKKWAGNGGLDRVNYYWFIDELGYLKSEELMIAQKKNKFRKERLEKIDSIYGGSQWWTLTADCAEYIIHFLNETVGFYHFFKYTNISDEMFFQTILLNSKYNGQIINNNLRLIDWSANLRSPKILDMSDLAKFKHSRCLYARKFDINIDANVIKSLYNRYLISESAI
ncbi:hypothetical protein OQX63_20375 [Pedobacter sp. PF22-3]|uniref:beta-1,6-N-acetylglucosaminyltransferase n=1 Tax=Pedobacter sp. PF22-3 TaxID=2994467 RepID=UPI002245FD93|nr:beta-1,6-N-acetylglucosaminyltransferase [Pedobacter sp. PF22-3]MCX2495862.1 hypothetical protein [Pedobacter sp. PF22-3]